MSESPSSLSLTRIQLHALVWESPMSVLARRYQISDVGLSKICKRHDVPIPGLGYWRRRETGHTVKVKRIPPSVKWDAVPSQVIVTLSIRTVPTPEELETKSQLRTASPIRVCPTLEGAVPLHKLVSMTKKVLSSRPSHQTFSEGRPASWILDVDVLPETTDRALRLMDALLKAVEDMGYAVRCGPPRPTWRPRYRQAEVSQPDGGRSTVIGVDDMDVCLGLRERRKRIPGPSKHGSNDYDFVSSGELSLFVREHIGGWQPKNVWKDTPSRPLEEKLGEVVVMIPLVAARHRAVIEKWKQEERDSLLAEDERLKRTLRLREQDRLRKGYDLQVASWRKAEELQAIANMTKSDSALASAAAGELGISIEEWHSGIQEYISDLGAFASLREQQT